MRSMHLLSAAEQVAAHLRRELQRGTWTGTMPGVKQLAAELGVNHKTAEAALGLLQRDGLLVGQGPRRSRRINLPEHGEAAHRLRVAILLSEAADRRLDYVVEIQHLLLEAGHAAFFPNRTLTDLGKDVRRVSRFVGRMEADAWVVAAGTRDVLEWFSGRPEPCFALFGRRDGLPMAATGPDKPSAYAAATRRLIALGHRRIALLCRKIRRLPRPGRSERAFLDELAAHGVPAGDYNLPDWVETGGGFQALLHSLFRVTPPTALILDEVPFVVATLQFFAGRGIGVPEDVSLVCTDPDPGFDWCEPSMAHISWESRPVVRRILRWAGHVSRGRPDLRQTVVRARFVEGGTIGPARHR